MSQSVLRYTLVVRHPETHEAVALVEGQAVPKWATDLVHADDLATGEGDSSPKPAKKAAAKRSSK